MRCYFWIEVFADLNLSHVLKYFSHVSFKTLIFLTVIICLQVLKWALFLLANFFSIFVVKWLILPYNCNTCCQNGLLSVVVNSCHFLSYLVAFGCTYLAVFGHTWPYLAVLLRTWSYMVVFCQTWPNTVVNCYSTFKPTLTKS